MGKSIKVYTDGGSRGNPGPSATGFVIVNDGVVVQTGSSYLGIGTNNQAEYKAVLLALKWLLKHKSLLDEIGKISFFLDSELVTNQLTGKYKIKDQKLKPLAIEAKKLENQLKTQVTYTSVRREKNKLADRLVNEALDAHAMRK